MLETSLVENFIDFEELSEFLLIKCIFFELVVAVFTEGEKIAVFQLTLAPILLVRTSKLVMYFVYFNFVWNCHF